MKPTHLILTAFLAASTLAQAATADRRLPAPRPEFKTPEQLAQWREEKAAQANSPSHIPNSSLSKAGAFFTGKPYLEESGTYAFLFRSYDPELNRWTTSDPSGFPDGANNIAYMAVPTSEFDWQGLKSVKWVYLWDSFNEDRQSLYEQQVEGELNTFKRKRHAGHRLPSES